MNVFLEFILCAIPLGMTFLYGAVGEIVVEKVGHLNLGIPGIMCMGGAGGCVALQMMVNTGWHPVVIVTLAILASFATGMLMGLLYSFLTVSLRSNQNVTGLVMTIFGVALTNFIMAHVPWDNCKYALAYFRYPFTPEDGSWIYCGCMVYLAIIIALAVAFILTRTRIGLNLRAVGENPQAADAVGIQVSRYKYALGGLFYIMDYSGSQEAYKSIEPLGWLAVALVIFTLWRPRLTIIGSVLFGALYIINSYLPSFFPEFFSKFGLEMKPLLGMIPYLVTVLVLIITSIRGSKDTQAPAGLGIPYFREER